jgi:hypothetical protein
MTRAAQQDVEGNSEPSSVVPPPSASASIPSDAPAGVADRSSGHADTTNSCPPWAAAVSDLRDHAVRVNRR